MLTFIENILKGVKQWTEGLLEERDYVTASHIVELHTDKADKVASATTGNFAGLDVDGNLTDSGSKASDFATAAQGAKADSALQAHQDISGKADKSEMSVSTSGDTTTITLKSGTSVQVLNAHQDISGKQNVTDNSLDTTSKTIVGAINELVAQGSYILPTASASTLGGIKVGNNLSIDANGVLSASGSGGGSGADASVYAKDGDGNAHITTPLNVSGSVQEGSPYDGALGSNVAVLTPEQKAEVEAETGTAYDYCALYLPAQTVINSKNIVFYSDEECTQKVGSTTEIKCASASISGGFFNLQDGESISAGMYYLRIERGIAGDDSHAEGSVTAASGDHSHAEGAGTTALGNGSHAEGINTIASGSYSHAEGINTTASNNGAHAEGVGTIARGAGSHVGGIYTIASSDAQHAIGKYNVEDTNAYYALIVGNGTDDNARSNAFAIDWDGNLILFNAGTPVVLTPAKLAALIA